MTTDTFQATNPPLGRKFTQDDVDSCWAYAQDYFLQILNGEYDVRQARDDLTRANLTRANLTRANLIGANLIGADLDFSAFPLWCGGADFKCNMKLVYQLLAHIATLKVQDKKEEFEKFKETILPYAKKSHRWEDLKDRI